MADNAGPWELAGTSLDALCETVMVRFSGLLLLLLLGDLERALVVVLVVPYRDSHERLPDEPLNLSDYCAGPMTAVLTPEDP